MKVQPRNITQFLSEPPSNIKAILIYGPDIGMVADHTKSLIANLINPEDPFNYLDLPFEKLKEDFVRLADEMATLSFTGERRVIRVASVPTSIPAVLKDILISAAGENIVVLTAGDLPPRSTFRQLFEKQEHLAAVACYKEDTVALARTITEILNDKGVSCEPGVLQYLQHCLVGDRLLVRSELEKLTIYIKDKKQVTLADAQACIGAPLETTLDELCSAVASTNMIQAEKSINYAFNEGVNAITILKALERYFLRLQLAKAYIRQGKNEKEALAKLAPPVFFKHIPIFQKHMRAWSEKHIIRALKTLEQAEQQAKVTANPTGVVCRHAIKSIVLAKTTETVLPA